MVLKGCLVSLAAARPERRVLEERERTHHQRPVAKVGGQGSGIVGAVQGFGREGSDLEQGIKIAMAGLLNSSR